MKFLFGRCMSAFMVSVMVASLYSCQHEYDLENINGEVTIGGDSLAFPLGSTDSIRLTTFIESQDLDMLKTDENGNYYLVFSQDFEEIVDLTDYTDDIMVDGVNIDFSKTLRIPDMGETGTVRSDVRLSMDFDENFSLEYSFERAAEAGLKDIERVLFDDARLSVTADMSASAIDLPVGMGVEVVVEFPEKYVFEDTPMIDGNTVVFYGNMDENGIVDFSPVNIMEIQFDLQEGESFVFVDDFSIRTLSIIVSEEDMPSVQGGDLDVDLNVNVGSENSGDELMPSAFYGRMKLNMDPIQQVLSMDGVPDFMKDDEFVLDFYNPHAELMLGTNAGIPVTVNASIVAVGGTQESIELSLPVPYSYDPDITDSVLYYLSEDRPGNIGDAEWRKADIASLISKIPDNVSVTVLPTTDDNSEELHYVECDAEYHVSGRMDMYVPFAFGENLYLSVEQTMEGLDAMVGELLAMTDITIGGNIVSTFPVTVEITAKFLDSNNNPLDIMVSTQTIASSGSDGIPVSTPLDLSVKSTGTVEDIHAVALSFTLLPGDEPGVSFSNKAFLQADISISAPGGITLDIMDLDNGNN